MRLMQYHNNDFRKVDWTKDGENFGGQKASLTGRLNDMGNEGNKVVQDGACFLSCRKRSQVILFPSNFPLKPIFMPYNRVISVMKIYLSLDAMVPQSPRSIDNCILCDERPFQHT